MKNIIKFPLGSKILKELLKKANIPNEIAREIIKKFNHTIKPLSNEQRIQIQNKMIEFISPKVNLFLNSELLEIIDKILNLIKENPDGLISEINFDFFDENHYVNRFLKKKIAKSQLSLIIYHLNKLELAGFKQTNLVLDNLESDSSIREKFLENPIGTIKKMGFNFGN
ncbi:MAG: hypothetical protein GY870_07920 [archaeon]|nr:hypothetical protein [archaeon]